jgi:hypothetical protein
VYYIAVIAAYNVMLALEATKNKCRNDLEAWRPGYDARGCYLLVGGSWLVHLAQNAISPSCCLHRGTLSTPIYTFTHAKVQLPGHSPLRVVSNAARAYSSSESFMLPSRCEPLDLPRYLSISEADEFMAT